MLGEIPGRSRRPLRGAHVRRRRSVPPPAGALHRGAGARPRRRHGRAGGARPRRRRRAARHVRLRHRGAPAAARRMHVGGRRAGRPAPRPPGARATCCARSTASCSPGGVLVGSEPANDHPLTRAVRAVAVPPLGPCRATIPTRKASTAPSSATLLARRRPAPRSLPPVRLHRLSADGQHRPGAAAAPRALAGARHRAARRSTSCSSTSPASAASPGRVCSAPSRTLSEPQGKTHSTRPTFL